MRSILSAGVSSLYGMPLRYGELVGGVDMMTASALREEAGVM